MNDAAVVDLRGPCGTLAGRLETERGVLQRRCRECSRRAGVPVYHWFDAETGEPVQGEPFGEDRGSVTDREAVD